MNIIVCVKQVLDPQIPPAKFKIDPEAKRVIPPPSVPSVINEVDERAVEAACRLKEKHSGKITVLTIGSEASASVVKHALSMGADEGFILADKAFDSSDSFSIAYILTKAIQKIGSYDLILCGRQAADWDEGLVGSILADNLNLPLVTLAQSIEVNGKDLKVKRGILEGYQFFKVIMPALITIGNEIGQPRLPSGWGIISAARKKVPIWNAVDIAAEPSRLGVSAARRKLVKLIGSTRERNCEIVSGETPAEAGAKLGERLRQARVI